MGVFKFTVGDPAAPSNEAPTTITIPTLTVAYVTQTTSITSYFSDPDSDPLTYTKSGQWPNHLNLDSVTGLISATVNTPVDSYPDLQVVATDPSGLSVTSNTFTVTAIKGQNRAPTWSSISTQNLNAGSGMFLGGFVVELDGDTKTYSNGTPTPPNIFSLNTSTGFLSVDAAATTGTHQFRVRVSDGTVTIDSPLITVNVFAASSGLNILQNFALVSNSVFPPGGIFWNNAQKDKRGGIIQWNDGDHVDLPAGANGVRYFNYLGPSYISRHTTIPAFYSGGVDGTSASNSNLQKPYTATSTRDPTETGPYVHEEDNYHFWYSPAEDKFIWCIGADGITPPAAYGSRFGVFDMAPWNGSSGAKWIYGNNVASATDWPSGPYWSQWIKPINTTVDINKNSPHGWSEYLDRGVAINYGVTRMFVIDKDETPGTTYRYKISNPIITFPYKINVGSDTRNTYGGETTTEWLQTTPNGTFPNPTYPGENRWGTGHNQFLNAGCVVGEWLYFIRPATGGPSAYPYSTYVPGERDSYPDISINGEIFKGYKTREFWRVRMVPPYNQYEKLAQFPEFEIIPIAGQSSNNGSWGPSLHYDAVGHKIYCLYKRLWEYTIQPSPSIGFWTDRTPSNFKRVLNSVGAIFTIPNSGGERHIVYCAGSSIDATTTAERRSWNRIKISGNVAPVARWTDCEMDQSYPGRTGTDIPLGKHRTIVYSNLHRAKVGTSDVLYYGNTTSATSASTGGYVWSFGGDYKGVPSLTLTSGQFNYPAGGYSNNSGRSDQYRIHTLPVNGVHKMELTVNQVPFYPYPGGPSIDPLVTQFGPKHPDGVSIIFDKRGYGWLGPGYFRFDIPTVPNSTGSGELIVYKFRLPEKSGGIAKGDAYEIPPQTVIRQSSRTPLTCTVGGTANDITLTPSTAQTSYVEGRMLTFTATATNTGPVSLNVNGLGLKLLHKNHATAMAAGDIVSGQTYTVTYQGFKFVLNDPSISWTMSKDQFGGSHFWGAYDPVDDCLVFATGGGRNGSFFLWRYSCLADAQGVHRWTRSIVRYNVASWWQTKANAMARNGVSVTSANLYNGSQVVIGDDLYFVVLVGTTNYADGNIAYMMKINLRSIVAGSDTTITTGLDTDLEMIPFPVAWSTDFDDPVSLINANTADHTQLRSMQALGHFVVLGPASNEYRADAHPWACWYNTNTSTWTVGKTYNQMRAEAPELPATAWTDITVYSGDPDNPYLEQPAIRPGVSMQRGRMVCVPETGEMWYFASGDPSGGANTRFGIVKYRILE